MRVFDSGARQGRHITQHGSDFTMSRLAHTRSLGAAGPMSGRAREPCV